MENYDKEIGSRIRIRRITLGLSQKKMGDCLGVTFQQIQKYENGSNSFNAIKMIKICEVLHISPIWLLYGDENNSNLIENSDMIDKYSFSVVSIINSFPNENSKKIGIKVLKSIRSVFIED